MKNNLKLIFIASLLSVLLIACKGEKNQTQEPPLSAEEIKFANKVGDKVFKENLAAFDLSKTQSKFPFTVMAPKECKIEEPSQNIVILKSEEIEYVISPNLSFVTIDVLKEAGKPSPDYTVPDDALLEFKNTYFNLTRIMTVNNEKYLCILIIKGYLYEQEQVNRYYDMMGMLKAK
jgi:ABC-type Fe3+-hydroxamate transport system substrate-binding protein